MSEEEILKKTRAIDVSGYSHDYPELIESLKVGQKQEFHFKFAMDEPEDSSSSIEERIRDYGKQIRLLRDEIRAAGFGEEENVTALILAFFEQEGLR